MKAKTLVPVTGNTYPVKDQLRLMGGRWDANAKVWMIPADKAADARALVSGAAPSARPARCRLCGEPPSRYNPVSRSGMCRDCYATAREDAETGEY